MVMVFAIHQHELATGTHVSPNPEPSSHLPLHPIPLGCPRALALGPLLHEWNLHCSSVLHMVMYMFQCYSLKLPHPCLLPLSPKVCSLHLCLLCCPACRIVFCFFFFNLYCMHYSVYTTKNLSLLKKNFFLRQPSFA